jgi:hypothetical protein
LVEIFLSSFSFEVTLFTVGRDLPVIVLSLQNLTVTGRSSPTVNNVTSKLNDDRKIDANSRYCLLLVEIFLSPFSIEVALFIVGRDLSVIVHVLSDIVYCWWRSFCHCLVLKWHCLLLVKIFLSPLSFEVTLFTVHFKTERWQEDLHQQ